MAIDGDSFHAIMWGGEGGGGGNSCIEKNGIAGGKIISNIALRF